jgi:hypothetical protein
VSLVRPANAATRDGPAIKFCSPLPPFHVDALPTGLDFAQFILSINGSCDATRRKFRTENKKGGLRVPRISETVPRTSENLDSSFRQVCANMVFHIY